MFKKIITVIILLLAIFLFSMIYWRGSNPHSYYDYWSRYPFFQKLFVCDLCSESNKSLFATTSEQVKAVKGEIVVNRNKIQVEIANSEAERTKGLSNRVFLDKRSGLLFVFDSADYHPFWMKDMLIYLDIIFLDENWQIISIEKNLSPNSFPKTFGGDKKSKYVLEINGGESDLLNLHVGDQVIFLNR